MAAPDDYATTADAITSPSPDFAAVTPNNSADLPFRCRALYIGGAGDVEVYAKDNATSVVFKNVPAGTILPIRTSRVRAALTTATNIVALK